MKLGTPLRIQNRFRNISRRIIKEKVSYKPITSCLSPGIDNTLFVVTALSCLRADACWIMVTKEKTLIVARSRVYYRQIIDTARGTSN
jgi:hypothetical protein